VFRRKPNTARGGFFLKKAKRFGAALWLLGAFALWTAAVCLVDVRPIGPGGSAVGLAGLNGFVHGLTGVHMTLYTITDWLGLVPLGIGLCFGMLGLVQWIRRKGLRKVDGSLLVLGGFYILVMGAYLLFETVVVNYRPVWIEGVLEASYPSSTTLLVLCLMPTARMQLEARIKNPALRRWTAVLLRLFSLFMVLGRLLSGVHWFSDIVGGVLLSGGLVGLYRGACAGKWA